MQHGAALAAKAIRDCAAVGLISADAILKLAIFKPAIFMPRLDLQR